jgi:four helix bundle protein
MKTYFDHEKLQVYQAAVQFYSWCEPLLERVPKSLSVHDQLERARTSIVLNIAEGNGKFTSSDRCRFFDTSRGSSLESAACLDLLPIKKLVNNVDLDAAKTQLKSVVSMLVGLIRANAPDRLHEEPVAYRVKGED